LCLRPRVWVTSDRICNECDNVAVPIFLEIVNYQMSIDADVVAGFDQSNRLDTLASLLMRRMASPRSGAMYFGFP